MLAILCFLCPSVTGYSRIFSDYDKFMPFSKSLTKAKWSPGVCVWGGGGIINIIMNSKAT